MTSLPARGVEAGPAPPSEPDSPGRHVRLRHRGFQVTGLERHRHPGGRCGLGESEAFRFDTGPPGVVDALDALVRDERLGGFDRWTATLLFFYGTWAMVAEA